MSYAGLCFSVFDRMIVFYRDTVQFLSFVKWSCCAGTSFCPLSSGRFVQVPVSGGGILEATPLSLDRWGCFAGTTFVT